MASFKCFIVGIIFTLALLLLVGVPVHMAIGVHEVAQGFQSGQLGYVASVVVVMVMAVFSGFKLAIAAQAIKASYKFQSE